TQYSSVVSYIVPEILQINEVRIDAFLQENDDLKLYQHQLDQIMLQRDHVLSESEEALLSEASEVLGSNGNTFSMLNNADLTFPTIKNEEGEEVSVTHGRYIQFLESANRDVRKAAF